MKLSGKISTTDTETLKQELAYWAQRAAKSRSSRGLGPAPREYMRQIRAELAKRESN